MRMNICVTMCFVQWMIGCTGYLYNINIILINMCQYSTLLIFFFLLLNDKLYVLDHHLMSNVQCRKPVENQCVKD